MSSLQLTVHVKRQDLTLEICILLNLLTCLRPNYNTTVGQSVPVRTNHFRVEQLPNHNVKQWAVNFTSERNPPKSKSALMQRNKGWWHLNSVQDEFKGVSVVYNG